MGTTTSQLEKELGNEFPEGERYFGFENKNAICYSNSILQALYYCEELRRKVLEFKVPDNVNDNPVYLLQDIFSQIQNNKKKVGVLSTKKLMNYVRKNNEMFKGDYHQDCHEFLMWFLNEMNDVLINDGKKRDPNKKELAVSGDKKRKKTFLENIFEGIVTSQTKCSACNTLTERDEPFLDLSVDVEHNVSLNWCLKNFSHTEVLKDNDKFMCDKCRSLQDAEKRILIKALPETLIVHLKRFKYDDTYKKMIKLNSKVAFPLELRVDINKEEGKFKLYELYGIIVHIGAGMMWGHYISIIKNRDKWFQFDDENVSLVEERTLSSLFGHQTHSQVAYMLFYQAIDGETSKKASPGSPSKK